MRQELWAKVWIRFVVTLQSEEMETQGGSLSQPLCSFILWVLPALGGNLQLASQILTDTGVTTGCFDAFANMPNRT